MLFSQLSFALLSSEMVKKSPLQIIHSLVFADQMRELNKLETGGKESWGEERIGRKFIFFREIIFSGFLMAFPKELGTRVFSTLLSFNC